MANISVEGYTYSEYARKGFGELVAVDKCKRADANGMRPQGCKLRRVDAGSAWRCGAGGRRGDDVVARVRESCREGAQAYWVCPLIEESETLQLKTALETFETIKATFPDLAVGLLPVVAGEEAAVNELIASPSGSAADTV